MTTEYRDEVLELLYQRHGFDFATEDACLRDLLEQLDRMNAPVEVAVEWLADNLAEVAHLR